MGYSMEQFWVDRQPMESMPMPPKDTSPGRPLAPSPSLGDVEALGRAFDELAPSFLTLSLHITGCPELAEDLIQEVFLEELAGERHLRSDVSLETRLMERLAQRLHALKPPGKNEPVVMDLEEAAALPLRWTPLSDIQQSEALNQLNTAIDLLPEMYREVVRLSLLEERSSQEIGVQIGRSPATVRSQLARGLDRLRQSLPAALGATFLFVNTGQSGAAPATPAEALHAVRTRFLTQASRVRGLHSIPAGTTFAMAVALLVVGLGGAFWILNARGEVLSPVQASDQTMVSPQTSSAHQTLLAPTAETSGLREAPATETLASAGARAHVFGRVVGPDGKAIEGANVTLYTWNEWDSPEGAPGIPDTQTFGWTQKTNRTGDYSFDVQVPKSNRPNLRVEAGSDFTIRNVWFDAAICNQAPLWPGENELSPVQLQSAGRLSVTLLTDTGLPAHPAIVVISPGANPLIGSVAGSMLMTQRDGSFHLDNMLAGQHRLFVQYKGQVRVAESIWIKKGQTKIMNELRMPEVAALPVVVTDMDGAPLKGAVLRFVRRSTKTELDVRDAGVSTDGLGRGTVRVLNFEGSELLVSLEGFVSEKPSYRPKPNQALLKVRMKPSYQQAFRAVDARTGNILADFTMVSQTKTRERWIGGRPTQSEAIDDSGAKSIYTKDGEWVEVQCLGYESRRLDPRASVDNIIVVPLRPIKKIIGRVVFNGRPVPMARIELAGGIVRPCPGSSPDELRTNFSSFDSTLTWLRVGPSGTFELPSFPNPDLTYRLQARTKDGQTVERWFTLAEFEGDEVNLGDLNLQVSGSVKVTLRTPAGIAAGGVSFLLDLPHGAVVGIPDPDGVFTLDGLVPGKHTLLLRKHPALDGETPPFEFSVFPDQTTDLSIDLHPFALSYQDLRLLDNGTPLSGCQVFLTPSNPHTPGNRTDWKGGYFGTTDKNGRVHGQVPAAGMAEVWVQGQGQGKRLAITLVDLKIQTQDPITIDF